MSIPESNRASIDLDEAARQLEQAAHDAQVAYACISLGNLDWAHTNAITACAEAAAAENALRAALAAEQADPVQAYGRQQAGSRSALPATATSYTG
jgi:hypothetical protein